MQSQPGQEAQEVAGADGEHAPVEPPGFSGFDGGEAAGALQRSLPVLNEWGEWAAGPANLQPAESDKSEEEAAASSGGPGMSGVAAGNVAALVALYACTGGANWITRTG